MEKTEFKVGWIYENQKGASFKVVCMNDSPDLMYPLIVERFPQREAFTRQGKYYGLSLSERDLVLETGQPEMQSNELPYHD